MQNHLVADAPHARIWKAEYSLIWYKPKYLTYRSMAANNKKVVSTLIDDGTYNSVSAAALLVPP